MPAKKKQVFQKQSSHRDTDLWVSDERWWQKRERAEGRVNHIIQQKHTTIQLTPSHYTDKSVDASPIISADDL